MFNPLGLFQRVQSVLEVTVVEKKWRDEISCLTFPLGVLRITKGAKIGGEEVYTVEIYAFQSLQEHSVKGYLYLSKWLGGVDRSVVRTDDVEDALD